jgi:hypothetical protein
MVWLCEPLPAPITYTYLHSRLRLYCYNLSIHCSIVKSKIKLKEWVSHLYIFIHSSPLLNVSKQYSAPPNGTPPPPPWAMIIHCVLSSLLLGCFHLFFRVVTDIWWTSSPSRSANSRPSITACTSRSSGVCIRHRLDQRGIQYLLVHERTTEPAPCDQWMTTNSPHSAQVTNIQILRSNVR